MIADDKNIIENLINETQSFILKNNISSFTLHTNEKLKNLNFKVKTNYILNIIPNNEELNWKINLVYSEQKLEKQIKEILL